MVHTKSSLFETHSLQVHCVYEKQYIELNIFLNHIATITKPHIFTWVNVGVTVTHDTQNISVLISYINFFVGQQCQVVKLLYGKCVITS